MATLFISDLHLSGERPHTTRRFLDFLAGPVAGAEALYVLGDLFEAWLGDDLVLPEYGPVLDALATLGAGGVPVRVMHGNRDFLLGGGFEARSGCRIIPDPTVIDLYGHPTLLMHGDTLCSDDLPYQQMREQLRNPAWIAGFLDKTAEERVAFARQLRETSRRETGRKADYIMDVNQETVERAMADHGVERLIHGHTHRPGIHELKVAGRPAQRFVLGDWYETGSVLVCDGDTGCRLTFP